ncbi:MAG: nucleotidyltransferase, partial [Thermodesulfobacteriota bacterium]
YKDLAIDLVPGRRQPGLTRDHSLYFRKTDTWIKTNIYKHISFVRQANCKSEIRAIKIWRKLHNLDFPSFYLEMSVIQALKGYKKNKLSSTLEKILKYLYLEFVDNKIFDPANTNNIISDDLSKSEKEKIKKEAYASLNTDNWSKVIW